MHKYIQKGMAKHDTERVPNERQERTRVRQELILTRWRHKMSTHPAFSARATGNHAHQRTWSPQLPQLLKKLHNRSDKLVVAFHAATASAQ